MKTYKINSNDFHNLVKVESIANKDWLKTIESMNKSLVGEKVIKAMNKAKYIALMITDKGNYYITAKPSYQPSLVYWLKSAGIDESNIKIVQKANTQAEMSLDEIKAKLLS